LEVRLRKWDLCDDGIRIIKDRRNNIKERNYYDRIIGLPDKNKKSHQ
jgi:hypothetical protein